MNKILVIQQKMIGDVLISSLICAHLKNRYPEAELHYAVHEHTAEVVRHHPSIDRLITKPQKQSIREFLLYLQTIRAEHYDLIIDAYGKLESNLMVLFSGSPQRISYHKWYTQWLYQKSIKRSPVIYSSAGNAIEDRLRLIFDEEDIQNQRLRPRIYGSDADKKWAQDHLIEHGLDPGQPMVMVSVLGSAKNKSLPAATMAAVLDHIAKCSPAIILLNYIPKQKALVDVILALTEDQTKPRIRAKVYGQSLGQFLALLGQCDALIGNEGGAVNMAKALDIPTFTIFSPWINKLAWSAYVDGEKHCAVHLKDHYPELYATPLGRSAKKNHQELYQKLKIDLFRDELNSFYKRHL
ncbi:MAG: glycosyltransferase family 9 protein [Flavobacteriaceae bacterium]|nr:glycosyltransferase family 9 protein [Flavobacteriaceae bacterium]